MTWCEKGERARMKGGGEGSWGERARERRLLREASEEDEAERSFQRRKVHEMANDGEWVYSCAIARDAARFVSSSTSRGFGPRSRVRRRFPMPDALVFLERSR